MLDPRAQAARITPLFEPGSLIVAVRSSPKDASEKLRLPISRFELVTEPPVHRVGAVPSGTS